jgi:hypothetical protein
MATSEPKSTARRLELYVRSLAYPSTYSQHDSLVDRLSTLEAEGHIADFEVTVWGKEVVITPATARCETGRRLLDKVNQFRRWGREHSPSLEATFDPKPVDSELTGDQYSVIELPMAVLAEYVGDELAYVSPTDAPDGTVFTVDDHLEALTTGRVRQNPHPTG